MKRPIPDVGCHYQRGKPATRVAAAANYGKKCTAACAGDTACGTGDTCKAVASASSSTIYGRACAKTN